MLFLRCSGTSDLFLPFLLGLNSLRIPWEAELQRETWHSCSDGIGLILLWMSCVNSSFSVKTDQFHASRC